MKKVIIILLFFVALTSCNTAKEKDLTAKVNYLKSPTIENCAQPYLFSNTKELFMSWTHKINDSIASLNYSKFLDDNWSKPV